MQCINEIPVDCFTLILKRFTLSEMIPLRSVCSHWKLAVEQICNHKRTLKLFGSSAQVLPLLRYIRCYWEWDQMNHNKDDCLIIFPNRHSDADQITESSYEFITYLFPTIENLVVCFDENLSAFYELPLLLEHWSATVTTLSFCNQYHDIDDTFPTRMCHAIGQLTSLKCLHLQSINLFPLDIDIILPALTNLEKLTNSVNYNHMSPFLSHLGSSCTTLTLKVYKRNQAQVEAALAANTELTSSVKKLYLLFECETFLSFVCERFEAIQCLDVLFPYWKQVDFSSLEQIVCLPKLTELTLHYLVIDTKKLISRKLCHRATHVKALCFNLPIVYEQFNMNRFLRIISIIFPNVEELTFNICQSTKMWSNVEQLLGEHNYFRFLRKFSLCENSMKICMNF